MQNELKTINKFDTFDYYLSVILRHIKLLSVFVIAGFVAAVIYNRITPVIYKASVLLMIEKEHSGEIGVTDTESFSTEEDYYRTQYKLLESRVLFNKIYDEMNLGKNIEFADGVEKLIENVKIVPVIRSRLVNINVTSRKQELSKEIAQNLAEAAIDFNKENRIYLGNEIIEALNSIDKSTHQKELLNSLPQIVNNDIIKHMKLKEAELSDVLANLSVGYNNAHPDIISIKKQLNVLRKRMSSETNKIIESIKIENSGQFYGNSIRIIDNAYLLKEKKYKRFIIPMGLVVGAFIFGLFFIFFIDLIDHSIKSPEDLKSVSKHRFLGSIPYEKDSLYLSESLRIISTSINNSLIKTNSNSLLVTSALPKDGKTSFSVKLAVAVAKANSRVLVIDGDFRKPSLHKIFNIPNEKGLSNLLSNDNIENSFYETSIKNLFIIPAGVLSSDISELLHSPKLSLFISWAEKNFDKVIVDCAAAINLADSIVYANYIHNLVFVIKSRKTNMYIAQRALKSLEETGGNVIGVVLNMYKDKQLSKYKPYY